jgi:hypothetical protein
MEDFLPDRGAIMREPALRVCGLAALALWCAALFAPISIGHPEWGGGWVFAAGGWLGPLALAFGWYANIPFAIDLIRCFVAGMRPGLLTSSFTAALAATALLPYRTLAPGWTPIKLPNGQHAFWIWEYIPRGPSLWLWFSAIALVWLAALADRVAVLHETLVDRWESEID